MSPVQVFCQVPSVSLSPQRAGKLGRGGSGRMAATSSTRHSRQSWSMNDLSSELLALIFEQLRDIDARSLASSRLLSRRFDSIVTPIKYEYLRLTPRILAPQAETHLPDALEKVYTLSRHVAISSDLDPRHVKRLIGRIHRLSSVTWTYAEARFRHHGFWLPSDIFSPQQLQLNKTKLFIEDLPLRHFDHDQQDLYLRAIPTAMLRSLKLASPAPPLTNRLESLKQLLLRSRQLETFYYQDRGQGTRFTFYPGEKLPAFTELVLRSYDWDHAAEDVAEHWDFTRIEVLRLIDVPVYEFLVSVPFDDLVGLHTLHCEDFSAHLPDRREKATEGLYVLIRRIRALHTLKITCHTQNFPIDAIVGHAKTLRNLRFRDHVGFSEEDRHCPTMWIDDLVLLSRTLVHLDTLELDMEVAFTDPPLFLRALCAFPSLHTLTLHVQTVLRPFEVVHPETDPDYEAALKVLRTLLTYKVGAVWRHITINVGGWRRHLVRRLGEAWREQNERGVYAERCFIMERSPQGEVTIREEVPIEG